MSLLYTSTWPAAREVPGNGVCYHQPGKKNNWYSSPMLPTCKQKRDHDGLHRSLVKHYASKVVQVLEWDEEGEVLEYAYSELR